MYEYALNKQWRDITTVFSNTESESIKVGSVVIRAATSTRVLVTF